LPAEEQKMKKSIISKFAVFSLLAAIIAFSVSDSLRAALFEQSDISAGEQGRLILERRQGDDSFARFDRVLLVNGSDTIEVFASEGRAIEQVFEEDLDLDGSKEILIQMDLGGSGGFKEFALLQNIDGNYTPIWEESGFCAGNAIVEDREGSGRPNLYIEYADTEVTPVREKTAVFTLENGELKRVE